MKKKMMGNLTAFPCLKEGLKEDCDGFLYEEKQGCYKCNKCGAIFDHTTYKEELDKITSVERLIPKVLGIE